MNSNVPPEIPSEIFSFWNLKSLLKYSVSASSQEATWEVQFIFIHLHWLISIKHFNLYFSAWPRSPCWSPARGALTLLSPIYPPPHKLALTAFCNIADLYKQPFFGKKNLLWIDYRLQPTPWWCYFQWRKKKYHIYKKKERKLSALLCHILNNSVFVTFC